jgi:hypothetical protein
MQLPNLCFPKEIAFLAVFRALNQFKKGKTLPKSRSARKSSEIPNQNTGFSSVLLFLPFMKDYCFGWK